MKSRFLGHVITISIKPTFIWISIKQTIQSTSWHGKRRKSNCLLVFEDNVKQDCIEWFRAKQMALVLYVDGWWSYFHSRMHKLAWNDFCHCRMPWRCRAREGVSVEKWWWEYAQDVVQTMKEARGTCVLLWFEQKIPIVPNARKRVSLFFCVEAAKTRVANDSKHALYLLFKFG